MNIITQADVDKFLILAKAGFLKGQKKELKNYTSANCFDGTNVPKNYYVSIEFSFTVDADVLDNLFNQESFDVSKKIEDLLK